MTLQNGPNSTGQTAYELMFGRQRLVKKIYCTSNFSKKFKEH